MVADRGRGGAGLRLAGLADQLDGVEPVAGLARLVHAAAEGQQFALARRPAVLVEAEGVDLVAGAAGELALEVDAAELHVEVLVVPLLPVVEQVVGVGRSAIDRQRPEGAQRRRLALPQPARAGERVDGVAEQVARDEAAAAQVDRLAADAQLVLAAAEVAELPRAVRLQHVERVDHRVVDVAVVRRARLVVQAVLARVDALERRAELVADGVDAQQRLQHQGVVVLGVVARRRGRARVAEAELVVERLVAGAVLAADLEPTRAAERAVQAPRRVRRRLLRHRRRGRRSGGRVARAGRLGRQGRAAGEQREGERV